MFFPSRERIISTAVSGHQQPLPTGLDLHFGRNEQKSEEDEQDGRVGNGGSQYRKATRWGKGWC